MFMNDLGLADAYSVAFEYAPRSFVEKHNDFEKFYQNPNESHRKPLGEYSDDTQMTIAIVELMIDDFEKRCNWTQLEIANKFVECFKRCPIKGYAKGFQRLLEEVKDGQELIDRIVPNSDNSGAAMRATPIGFYRADYKIEMVAIAQAKLTHDTPDGIAAAMAAATMRFYVDRNLGPMNEMGKYLQDRLNKRKLKVSRNVKWTEPWREPVGPKGWMAVRGAITAIQDCCEMSADPSMDDLVKRCVNQCGDVDTLATIAVGTMVKKWGFSNRAIRRMMPQIQPKCHGNKFLTDLSRKLYSVIW